MSPPRLLASLLAVFALIAVVYALIGWPFGGDDNAPAAAVEGATNTPEPIATALAESPAPHEPDTGDDCAPGVTKSFLSANQIVSYYGNPYAEQLGILGQHDPEELASMLKQRASDLDALNGFRGVQPAFHIVYETAQPQPTDNGLYLLYVDDGTMQEYFDLACREHFFVFLDLQIGRSSVEEEVTKVLPYLHGSNVHLAIDPEFTMNAGEIPGQVIGHVNAAQINAAQQILSDYAAQNHLPDKILVVHQFDEAMISDPENIAAFPNVHVVIDMDGFGPKETKVRKFGTFSAQAPHSGLKIFYKQDEPSLLTDEEVQRLNPDVVIYQ
jgi:hypothetical protein